jgi:hypothetical protein
VFHKDPLLRAEEELKLQHTTGAVRDAPFATYLDSARRSGLCSHHDVHVHILPADLNRLGRSGASASIGSKRSCERGTCAMRKTEQIGLTSRQILNFIDDGFIKIENAFSPQLANQCRNELWSEIGLVPPYSWPQWSCRPSAQERSCRILRANQFVAGALTQDCGGS